MTSIPQPVEMPLRALEGSPVSRELAEFLLMQDDIGKALRCLRLWKQSYAPEGESDEGQRTTRGSLFRDAIVQFVACFDKTSAYPLSVNEIYGTMSGADVYFKWLRDLRDAYAAHRFGAARQCAVGVLVHPQTGEILGAGQLFAVYAGPAQVGHDDLIMFVQTALKHVDAKVETLRAQLLADAQKLPPAERLALKPVNVHGMDPNEMRLSRGDLQRVRAPGKK